MKMRNSFILGLITLLTTSCAPVNSSSTPSSFEDSNTSSSEEPSSMIPISSSEGENSDEISSSEDISSSEETSSSEEPSSEQPSSSEETSSSENNSSSEQPSSETPVEAEYVTIHYQRNDNNYSPWALWLWEKGYDGNEYQFNGSDSFGAYARYSLNTWSSTIETNGLGFIVKSKGSWDKKDVDADRFINFNTLDVYQDTSYHIYLFSGDANVYTSPEKDPVGDDPTIPPSAEPIECDSWKDFSYWDTLPESYWTTINKYNGDRLDFRNESIYFTITTRFYDGDSSNNMHCWDNKNNAKDDPGWRGDFKGLIQKMDYIKALGFTAIWITPVVENASGYDYHGYHAINHDEVDARYLSNDVDFQDVINEAHKRDMKIVLDVVFNHTGNFGEENLLPLFYKEGDPSSINCLKMHPDSPLPANYFSLPGGQQYDERIAAMKNTRNNGADPNYIYHHYGNFSWESFGEQVAQIAGDCVDLNTENPVVAEYLTRCYGDFIRMGVDAFRIDTMKHISRLTFNNYITPALYEIARRCGNDNFFMFGEVCTRVREVWNRNIPALSAPFYTWKEEKEYPWGDVYTNLESIEEAYNDNSSVSNERTSRNALLNNNLTYHTPDYSAHSGMGVIDFPMHWNFANARDAFNVAIGNDQYYNDSTYNVMYVDSHDYGPDGISTIRYNKGTQAWAENLNLMFTFRGIPCLYYGSEIEFQKGKEIDKGPEIALANSGRAYYGKNLEGTVTANDFGSYSASGNVDATLKSVLSKHLIKLNKIRQAIPALSMGQYTRYGVSGDMAFIRRYTSGTIDSLALVAISSSATFTNVPNGTYVDVITGDEKRVSNGTLSTSSLSQGNLRVYVLENSSTGNLSRIGESTAYLK